MNEYQKKYYKEHKDDYKRRSYKWKRENPERLKINLKNWRTRLRKKALSFLGNGDIKCIYCGCEIYEYLEINHKKLYLKAFFREDRGDCFMRRIIKDKDRGKKYEITCRVCNSLHYLIKRYPNIKNKHTILWGKK